MINIKNKEDCCGCSACESKCPMHCISMYEDTEGFLYPQIDEKYCVDCGICEAVCPTVINKKVYPKDDVKKEEIVHQVVKMTDKFPLSYVCFTRDEITRFKSTSGGVFSAISEYVLQKNGIIFGVIINEQNDVVHTKAETKEEIAKIRGAKYVQSYQEGIYRKIRNEVEKGRLTLYTGTPCQVEGLKKFLGKEYENLITLDIFCHGVGSPLYWKKYLAYMETLYHSSISKIQFREKTYGYNSATMALYFENGKSSHKDHDGDLFWSPFSKNYIYRPSCYACAFKKINHVSDFSVGDFWQTNELPKEYENANGCSLLICHSKKALIILEKLRGYLKYISYDLEKALVINGGHQPSMLIASAPYPDRRAEFFSDLEKLDLKKLNNKYMPLSLKKRVKCTAKPLLYNLGILDYVKKIKRKNQNEP